MAAAEVFPQVIDERPAPEVWYHSAQGKWPASTRGASFSTAVDTKVISDGVGLAFREGRDSGSFLEGPGNPVSRRLSRSSSVPGVVNMSRQVSATNAMSRQVSGPWEEALQLERSSSRGKLMGWPQAPNRPQSWTGHAGQFLPGQETSMPSDAQWQLPVPVINVSSQPPAVASWQASAPAAPPQNAAFAQPPGPTGPSAFWPGMTPPGQGAGFSQPLAPPGSSGTAGCAPWPGAAPPGQFHGSSPVATNHLGMNVWPYPGGASSSTGPPPAGAAAAPAAGMQTGSWMSQQGPGFGYFAPTMEGMRWPSNAGSGTWGQLPQPSLGPLPGAPEMDLSELMRAARAALCPPAAPVQEQLVMPAPMQGQASQQMQGQGSQPGPFNVMESLQSMQQFPAQEGWSGASQPAADSEHTVRRRLNMSNLTATPTMSRLWEEPMPASKPTHGSVASEGQEALPVVSAGADASLAPHSMPAGMASATSPGRDVVHQPQPPQAQRASLKKQPYSPAEIWVRSQLDRQLMGATEVTYPCGVTVDLLDCAASMQSLIAANLRHKTMMYQAIQGGDLLRRALQILRAKDKDRSGFLTWGNAEVRDFILGIFEHYRLQPPSEAQIYNIYMKFDVSRSMYLDARDCLCMADAFFQSLFVVDPQGAPPAGSLLHCNSEPELGGSRRRHEASSRQREANQRDRGGDMIDFSDSDAWDIPSEAPSWSMDSSCSRVPARVHLQRRRRGSHADAVGGRRMRHSGSTAAALASHYAERRGMLNHAAAAAAMDHHGATEAGTQTPSPPRQGLAAAATAAAAAAGRSELAGSLECAENSPGTGPASADALFEARAETQRLRRELEELRELEAACSASSAPSPPSPLKSVHEPTPISEQPRTPSSTQSTAAPRTAFSPMAPPPDAALLWTARAHAENRRLERELASLRAVAQRQRGEVQWLSDIKASAEASVAVAAAAPAAEAASPPAPQPMPAVHDPESAQKEVLEERLRDLRQRERHQEVEKGCLAERERMLREQELKLTLDRERALMHEKILDQRERELEMKRQHQKELHLREREMELAVERAALRRGHVERLDREDPDEAEGNQHAAHCDNSTEYANDNGASSSSQRQLNSVDAGRARHASNSSALDKVSHMASIDTVTVSPVSGLPSPVAADAALSSLESARGAGGSSGAVRSADSGAEPEAEADASETAASVALGAAGAAAMSSLPPRPVAMDAASLENRRLKQELEGLRMLARWQQGEVDAALACSAGSSLTAPVDPAPHSPARSSIAAQEPMAVQPQQFGAAGDAGCIPAVPSPGASPAGMEHQRHPLRQRAVQAGIDEYDRTVRTLMSRVQRHGDILSAGGGALSESATLEAQNSHRDARAPQEAAGASGGGAEAALAVHQPFPAPQRGSFRGMPRSGSLGSLGSSATQQLYV